ncbi:hypothetical protein CITFRE_13790 [Citrobacter freundii]|nr:hypothetical protein CITFRE_13790 [Citrobacter freundii]
MIVAIALSISASANTTAGAFPPNSRCALVRFAAAEAATCKPARTEPVIETSEAFGFETTSEPVLALPNTTLNAPLGNNGAASSANSSVLTGVVSLGFNTTVLPAASAGAIFHTAIMNG